MSQVQMASKVMGKTSYFSPIDIDLNNVAACQYATKTAFFNLDNIMIDEGEKDDQNQQVEAPVGFSSGEQIIFNYCEHFIDKSLDPNVPANCPDDSYAFIVSTQGDKKCYKLSQDDKKADTFGTELKNEDGNINGIQLNFVGGGEQCESDTSRTYNLTVQLTCDTQDGTFFVGKEGDDCAPILKYKSNKGCPLFTFDKFQSFLNEYNWLWGAAFVVGGLFLAFFGNKALNFVIFLVTATVFFFVVGSLFF